MPITPLFAEVTLTNEALGFLTPIALAVGAAVVKLWRVDLHYLREDNARKAATIERLLAIIVRNGLTRELGEHDQEHDREQPPARPGRPTDGGTVPKG